MTIGNFENLCHIPRNVNICQDKKDLKKEKGQVTLILTELEFLGKLEVNCKYALLTEA